LCAFEEAGWKQLNFGGVAKYGGGRGLYDSLIFKTWCKTIWVFYIEEERIDPFL
jgi:hypothetical protein